MRVLPLLAVLAAFPGAQAQAPVVDASRFAQFQIGNLWEYTLTAYVPAPPVVTGYYVATVDGETTIDGERYVVLTTQRFGPDRAATSPRFMCAYSRTTGAAPASATTLSDYDCSVQLALPPTLPFRDGSTTVIPNTTVAVSGQTVAVDSLMRFSSMGTGAGGAYLAYARTYATGIGYVGSNGYGRYHGYVVGWSYDDRTTLTYARIAGTVYGASAVAGEAAPDEAPAFALTSFPNPSAEAFQIAVSGATGRVDIDVFDALGRRAVGGTASDSAPFTFRASSPGVYIVRATDAAGQVASRRVVRR